jgi:YidC/Oxa1 family membrane protein insertase
MDKRFFLFLIVALLGLNLYLSLVLPKPKPKPGEMTSSETISGETAGAPSSAEARITPEPPVSPAERAGVADFGPPREVVINTGVYRIRFTSLGARPEAWEITDPRYGHVADEAAPIAGAPEENQLPQIIPEPPVASGLQPAERPLEIDLSSWNHESFNRVTWKVEGPEENASDGTVHLAFESPEIGGLVLRKEFTFHRPRRNGEGDFELGEHAEGYLSEMRLVIRNAGTQKIVLSEEAVGMRLTWGPGIGNYEPTGFYNLRSPLVLADGETWYKSPSVGRPRAIAAQSPDGVTWAGLQSRYFMAAIVPTEPDRPVVSRAVAELRPENTPRDRERWGKYSPLLTVALEQGPLILDPGQERVDTYDLYVGPKRRADLLAAGHDLQRADFYSSWNWMRALCIGLTHVLNVFHGVVGSYGWSILLLTVIVRLLLYPVTHHQMRIMAKTQRDMARVKPFIDEIREKYKGDMAKIQRETMAIYKEHGVNPFAGVKGCLPLLLQMPIFLALWKMLYSSIELRGAPFLWISDLSGPDALFHTPWLATVPLIGGFLGTSINLLPILMALTQWLTMQLGTVKIEDPNQRTMMIFMPIMLTVMLYRAPSGLMLYWVAGNIWQMGHQYLTTKHVQREAEAAEAQAPPSPPKREPPSGSPAKSARSSLGARLAEKRREAAKAREKAIAESPSLPRWVRRGGR